MIEVLLARGATVHLPMMESALPPHLHHERVKAAPQITLDNEAQVTSYYATLPELWASIHLVGGFAMSKLVETSLPDFEKQWRMNTVTCFLTCREAVRAIRKTGKGGRIVNVAARPVVQPAGGMISYVTSKAGVAALTQSLAPELLADNILINAVLPSTIDTPANRKSMPNADHASWPKPQEIAQAIAFLASADNALTTGTLVPVYGRA